MLRLYNTLTRKIEEFKPLDDKNVGLYTCGPTVYSTAHIGNLRTYMFEDVLRRVLMCNGYAVKHVMNITDVGHLTSDADTGEDKIERAARAEHRSAHDIAREHEAEFFRDCERLNILKPTKVLRATETIDLQIALIKKLEKLRYTYATSDGVYFDTEKFPNYGRLSGQRQTDKKAGARVEVNKEKRHPMDFALWKFSPKDEKRQMEWKSPWGIGFPGWHIECSAMSMKYLGEQFDIHTGGIDHIPVHHENEIAQSEAATGKHPFVRFWIHGEHLILPEKRMGKSERNAITVNDLVARQVHPLAFRYLVLQTHYRSTLSFNWDAIEAAQQGLYKLWLFINTGTSAHGIGCAEYEKHFHDAVDDDLDTPKALAVMHEMLGSNQPWSAKLQSLSVFERVFGLGLTQDAQRSHFQPLNQALTKKINALIQERELARQKNDWARADELRERINAELKPFHRTLEDTSQGPEIRPQ